MPKQPKFTKYLPLEKWFGKQPKSAKQIKLTLDQVAEILGKPLPASSTKLSWWTNVQPKIQSHRTTWLNNGWMVSEYDQKAKRVKFVRAKPSKQQFIYHSSQSISPYLPAHTSLSTHPLLRAMPNLKPLFLDPNIIYLNHGSFGACPQPVFDQYQYWQRELERQPVEFLGRKATERLAGSRAALAAYLGADADELIYFPNPTTALNMVARSVHLEPGDEILTTDHEYGALDRTWRFLIKNNGAKIIRCPIQLPLTSEAEFVEHFWALVTERTRVIFISHITSPTALIFPVAEICRRARERGILTIVDGAHAPGQIPLNLHKLGCDVYSGACHKWMCGPKGAAFVYARPEIQAWLNPLVVSWGWGDENINPSPGMGETRFVRFHEWQGTRDLAAYLTVPAAIKFLEENNWEINQRNCHALALETRNRINTITGFEPLSTPHFIGQMAAVRLPDTADVTAIKTRLYDEFHIEVPLHTFNNMNLIRVSFQAYNTQSDADALVDAMRTILEI